MGLFDSLKSVFSSKSDQDNAKDQTPLSSAEELKRKAAADAKIPTAELYSGKAIRGKVSIDSRFERLRSSISGTMSSFFQARDSVTGRIVGVKLCDLEKVEFFESRFKGMKKPSEGEIALGMKHPLVIETYEIGLSTKNEPFLIMEFINGPTLQKVITDRDEDSVRGSRLNLIRNMAESLHYVHEKGFIHRDICPRNYICQPDFQSLKLIDFGLTVPASKAFMSEGNRTGTPLYMSPEIVRRRPTDKRVDIFSFGVSCYALCTFEMPWQSSITNGRAALHHDSDPPTDILKHRPDLDPRLGRAIMQALQPKLDDRTASLDIFLRQIQGVTEATPA